jgi:hypothetical protein
MDTLIMVLSIATMLGGVLVIGRHQVETERKVKKCSNQ